MCEYTLNPENSLGPVLSPSDITAIAAIGREAVFEAGDPIVEQHETAAQIHILMSGLVKTSYVNAAGGETVIRIHLKGSIIGLSTLTSLRHFDATSRAMRLSRTIMVPTSAFLSLLEVRPSLSVALIRLLVGRLSDMHFRIGELQHQTVERRLIHLLVALSSPNSSTPRPLKRTLIPFTHEELAQMIQSRRPTVTATLARLADRQLVQTLRRSLVVIDRAALIASLNGGESTPG
ncbi:transcriptional regulator, Crp/Fnr family [Roseovarius lutimaris]|uniref:Transcriptional regulator, Crp/Fnr family n=1 Tax=Roseovarius lutimaris TaxID=1005928 RepID=A0A1I5BSF2_9RHOB|nr:Crp/Fnr family transcriptional regulator [Roseovarius lutimaris]SFN77301.1 transcriptional regulator, Crp/Fnr family [Roseovarius lutimaris]